MKDLDQMAEKLQRHNFDARVVDNAQEAIKAVLSLIPDGASVGFGGSATVRDLGLYDTLKESGRDVFWHWMAESKDMGTMRKKAANADYYLLSANALTEEGEIINTDGAGNRVASMFYGPKNVIFVIGKNKLVADYEAAINRIRNVASPLNAKRLNLSTPCAILGYCTDCSHPQRMCHITGVLHRPTSGVKMHVLLVNEDLGF